MSYEFFFHPQNTLHEKSEKTYNYLEQLVLIDKIGIKYVKIGT